MKAYDALGTSALHASISTQTSTSATHSPRWDSAAISPLDLIKERPASGTLRPGALVPNPTPFNSQDSQLFRASGSPTPSRSSASTKDPAGGH
ncbi:hypothetical protein D9613_010795 [Agrocybe pediades]|uniref:Uncharacterized protein n=1 Tax=Agrocybe pediades TaxID=84607 RepID=A0A8H4VKJ7_9AGAR|nr:hypothetical protein D9613_010795 [Agrocybe pediades]